MPIITPPKIVRDALDEFLASLFKNTPQRKHLAHYLTGLMISDNFLPGYPVVCRKLPFAEAILLTCCRTRYFSVRYIPDRYSKLWVHYSGFFGRLQEGNFVHPLGLLRLFCQEK